MEFQKLVDALPTDQAAVDIFKDRWASTLPGDLHSGPSGLFEGDPRPYWALRAFGHNFTSFNGASILELGPLEGGHTYKLEQLGGQVLAIDGNAEAFLKCLIVKEIYSLNAKFMVGDFLKYLEQNETRYEMVFASGVLYHMMHPLKLIKLICDRSDRSFIWSHYYTPETVSNFYLEIDEVAGFSAQHHRNVYENRDSGIFWGGLAEGGRWLLKNDIINAFKYFGHDYVEVLEDNEKSPNAPTLSLVTRRT